MFKNTSGEVCSLFIRYAWFVPKINMVIKTAEYVFLLLLLHVSNSLSVKKTDRFR